MTAVKRPGAARALGVPVAVLPVRARDADRVSREAMFRDIWRDWEEMAGDVASVGTF